MKSLFYILLFSSFTFFMMAFAVILMISIVSVFVLMLFLLPVLVDTFHLSKLFLFLYVPLFIGFLWLFDRK